MPPRRTRAVAADTPAVAAYTHAATRKNIPPAGLAAQGRVREAPKQRYAYDPHLPPALRFDPTGTEDRLPELLAEATRRPLTADEARTLAGALRHREPWLEWAGKREAKEFAVDPVALHIHERVSAQAILKAARREDLAGYVQMIYMDPPYGIRFGSIFSERDRQAERRGSLRSVVRSRRLLDITSPPKSPTNAPS